MYNNCTAKIILADGTILTGQSIGSTGTTIGEIVFTTSMTGYQETLTDPSYFGQIVNQTFPLIGNYGANNYDLESEKCYLKGYIIKEICDTPSNFRSIKTLNEFLKEQNIIGISGIDTRSLTRKIREIGVVNGMITTENIDDLDINNIIDQIKEYKIIDAVKSVSIKQNITFDSDFEDFHVALFDFGYKYNIRKELIKRGGRVTVIPYNTTAKELREISPDGIMLSNGPGDPAENTDIINNLKDIMKLNIPIFGICLGHQLMALANGGQTEKLKYGHRGANQPVIDTILDRIFITTQNHGYAVKNESIDPNIGTINHKNVNDGSCEGILYKNIKAFTVQFHPEACAGPQDTSYLFDNFINLIKESKKNGT